MKKLICTIMAGLLMATSVFAAGVNVKVNNKPIDIEGVIVDGRTMVPVRGVFEELGYTVTWNANTKTATLTKGNGYVTMTQGNTYFDCNGIIIEPDVPQQIINDRFMLPLRAVGEALGATVNWDPNTKTAFIQTSGLTIMQTYTPDLENK